MKQRTFCSNPLRLGSLSGILMKDPLTTAIPDEVGKRILLSVQETLRQLAPVGDNDRRSLWFEVLDGGKSPAVKWLEVSFSIYRDFHYMLLGDGRNEYHAVMNRSDSDDAPSSACGSEALTRSLSFLHRYLSELVRKVVADPEEYNRYLDEKFPFELRSGSISASELERIFGKGFLDAEEGAEVMVIPGDLSRFSTRSFPVMSMENLPSGTTPEQIADFIGCVRWDPLEKVRENPWRLSEDDVIPF